MKGLSSPLTPHTLVIVTADLAADVVVATESATAVDVVSVVMFSRGRRVLHTAVVVSSRSRDPELVA